MDQSNNNRTLSDILAHAEGTHQTVVIAAIPEENDYVWKISSEKVPHLTLLYLGKMEMGPKISKIAEFLEHAASTSLYRFGLEVDRRDTLGEDDADVLFFSKRWETKDVAEFRSLLLKNNDIYEAYNSTEQFPEWTPHLTLGYPESPAKEGDRDHGIGWVSFDRVALWVGDYEGPEFRLKNYYDMEVAMGSVGKQTLEETLAHFGVRGMKWGVRRSQAQLASSSEDAKKAAELAAKVKKSGTGALSNKELDDLTKRLQFEQNYQKVIAQNQGAVRKGHRFTKEVLSVGSTANDAIKFVNSPAGRLTVLALGAAKTTGKHVKTVK